MRQVSKTSVSFETSSKKHTSSLQNERFVRDFLQKSHVKSQNKRYVRDFLKNSHVKVRKTNVSYETSSKSPTETPIGAHTSRSPAKQSHDSSPSKRHRFTRQSQCNNDIHLYHNSQPPDSLRLPRIFQSTAPITKYYLRHASQPHDSLRLPRKSHFHTSKPAQSLAPATKNNNIISCKLHQNLHHTTRLK